MKKWWSNYCNHVSTYLRKLRYIFLIPNKSIFSSPTRPSLLWILACNKTIRDTQKWSFKQRKTTPNKSTNTSKKRLKQMTPLSFRGWSRVHAKQCTGRAANQYSCLTGPLRWHLHKGNPLSIIAQNFGLFLDFRNHLKPIIKNHPYVQKNNPFFKK